MEKIKVMHIIRPADGGMKEHMLSLIRHADRQKFEVVVACPADSSMVSQIDQLGIRVFPLPLKGELDVKKDLESIGRLAIIMAREKVAVAHCHGSKAGLVGRMAALIARTPVVVFTAHNFIFYDDMSLWKKQTFAWAEKILSMFTDQIIAVSGAIQEGLVRNQKIASQKVVTIYNGIDTERYGVQGETAAVRQSLGLSNGPVVGIIARMAPQKGLNHFLTAAAEVNRTFPDSQFIIVGDGPLKNFLHKLAGKLGIRERVHFLGHRNDIEAILPVLDVFVLSSVTEGLPLTVLEAMAAGKPVVASAVGGIPEILQDGVTGFLVPPKDYASLALAITNLLRDRDLRLAMGREARRTVLERFSLQNLLTETSGVYDKLLKSKGLYVR